MPHQHSPVYLPEEVIPDKRLGRSVIDHDIRNTEWPVEPRRLAMIMETRTRDPQSKVWYTRGIFHQYQTSTCTSQATARGLLTHPHSKLLRADQKIKLNDPDFRVQQYLIAQRDHDPWVGMEPDYYGTSTRAIMLAYRAAGMIKEFRWCFSLQDVLDALLYGPVVIGTYWYDSFDQPGEDGRIEITPNASQRGGHETVLTSRNHRERSVRGVNSWGTEWGDKGRFEMSYATLERLLGEDGEAAVMVLAA